MSDIDKLAHQLRSEITNGSLSDLGRLLTSLDGLPQMNSQIRAGILQLAGERLLMLSVTARLEAHSSITFDRKRRRE